MSNDDTTTDPFSTDLAFYPSVRQGHRPKATFNETQTTVQNPGTVDVELTVTGRDPAGATEQVTPGTTIRIHGPGDVIDIDDSQIVRRDPLPDSNNFPPNYLPFVEFDRADYPWLFSPTRADEHGRNRPWCTLVTVNKHADRVTVERGGPGPLPTLFAPVEELPDLTESWAFAHVQALGGRPPTSTAERQRFTGRSNLTVSRLLSPRNLVGSTTYLAAIVPTYEPGRRAGLGQEPYLEDTSDPEEPADGDAQQPPETRIAWTATDSVVRLPVYDLWEFSTAPEGDFEQLLRRLEPRDLGPEVGTRTIDTSNPGPPVLRYPPGSEGATAGMGGALQSADLAQDPDPYGTTPTDPNDPISILRDVMNQPDTVVEELGLPAVGPPKYGQWVADERSLRPPSTADRGYPQWFNELNTDPRHRAAAGFGTQIIQQKQEDLIARAWEQYGDLAIANERARGAQLAADALLPRYEALDTADVRELIQFAGPLLRFQSATTKETFLNELGEMGVPPSVTTPAFRRITRTTGPLGRRSDVDVDAGMFVDRLAGGAVAVDGGEVISLGDLVGQTEFQEYGPTIEQLSSLAGVTPIEADELTGEGIPAWRRRPDGEIMSVTEAVAYYEANPDADPAAHEIALAVGAIIELKTELLNLQSRLATASRVTTAGVVDRRTIDRVSTTLDRLDENSIRSTEHRFRALTERGHHTAIDPTLNEGFVTETIEAFETERTHLIESLEEVQPGADPDDIVARIATAEQALTQMQERVDRLEEHIHIGPLDADAIDEQRRPFESLELQAFADGVTAVDPSPLEPTGPPTVDSASGGVGALQTPLSAALDPKTDLQMRLASLLSIRPEQLALRPNPLDEILAHPRYYEPMYETLRDLDQEYLMPGAGDIPNDTIGAVVTNPAFIEAFMSGLNHELSRELRWQRFPTDRRGTYFRHFWDRRGVPGSDDPDDRADITPMHTWNSRRLGANNPNRADADDPTAGTVVLLVRGELLKRFPDTIIYMTKAVESVPDEGEPARVPYMPGRTQTPEPTDYAGADADKGPQRIPDFRGTLDPDVTFFGFDLTVEEAVNDPYHRESTAAPADHNDEGWFFVFEEPPGELHFGLDEADPEDAGAVPPGITRSVDGSRVTQPVPEGERVDAVEKGWSALSWGHVTESGEPDAVTHLSVSQSRLGRESWAVQEGTSYAEGRTWKAKDDARWGYNSAHIARALMQQPVRVSIHADDLLPDTQGGPPISDGGTHQSSVGGDRR